MYSSHSQSHRRLPHWVRGRHAVQVEWGIDMSSEHERYLAERVFKSPVIVYNYPKDIKVGVFGSQACISMPSLHSYSLCALFVDTSPSRDRIARRSAFGSHTLIASS